MSEYEPVLEAFHAYATGYARLQAVQESNSAIPLGDQKAGCIGEFYARLFLKQRFAGARVEFGGHSNKGWDLLVSIQGGSEHKVQVRTVSAYSTKRRLTPVHCGWHELFVVYLGRGFNPIGFWICANPA
ncbi:MAG: hypothetical protein ACREF4_11040, partial [Gammaproteobacteria bacterium]